MAKIKKTRYALLGFLSMGPFSGYDIKKRMEHSTDHFWRESDSSIYPILSQLLKEGLVSYERANTDSGRPKKLYSITGRGQKALEEWLRTFPDSEKVRNELLLKVFFGWHVEREVIIDHIKQYRRMEERRLRQYQQSIAQRSSNDRMIQQQWFQLLTMRAGITYAQASLDWCDETIRALVAEKD